MKNPLVSVIIPVYNSEKSIERAIKSVLAQTHKNIELIVVDDYSTDKTVQILKKLRKNHYFKIICLNKNSGTAGKPRNIGIKNSNGKLLAFLDSDDYWHEDKLKYQIDLYKNKYINCLNTIYFDKYNNNTPLLIRFLRTIIINLFVLIINYKKSIIFLFNPIVLSSVLINKSIFKNINFSEDKNIAGAEDLSTWFQIISEKGYKIKFLNKSLVRNFKSPVSLHGDYLAQVIRLISTIATLKLSGKIRASSIIIIFTILAKLSREILKYTLLSTLKYGKRIIALTFISYFVIFYSPLFNIIGKPLLYFDEQNLNQSDLVVVNTNYGYDKYFNFGFNYRFNDLNINKDILLNKKIILLGSEKYIPQKLILKGLLINEGFVSKNIYIILDEIKSKPEEMKYLYNFSKMNNYKSIIYFTSPYNTKLSKTVYKKYESKFNLSILKSSDWPKENHPFLERFSYKKMIISEYYKLIQFRIKSLFNPKE